MEVNYFLRKNETFNEVMEDPLNDVVSFSWAAAGSAKKIEAKFC